MLSKWFMKGDSNDCVQERSYVLCQECEFDLEFARGFSDSKARGLQMCQNECLQSEASKQEERLAQLTLAKLPSQAKTSRAYCLPGIDEMCCQAMYP